MTTKMVAYKYLALKDYSHNQLHSSFDRRLTAHWLLGGIASMQPHMAQKHLSNINPANIETRWPSEGASHRSEEQEVQAHNGLPDD
jgi:hypothetical protein